MQVTIFKMLPAEKKCEMTMFSEHCSPFNQVDSHDLRFPWIAFFTTTYVKAGTELVWDYNYEVCSCNNADEKC